MDYQKVYNLIIDKARLAQRSKTDDCYYERHHIVPKCLGGNDDPDNLVYLTAREHFIAHKLLREIYPKNKGLRLAVWVFVNKMQSHTQQRNYRISSREYEQAKQDMIDCLSNRVVSKETREKQSKARKGKPKSDEHKKQISIGSLGKKKSVVHYKFTYNDYLKLYNEFIEINKTNPHIGIELYCSNTNHISSTTFRKFIKDNKLFCPRAKKRIN